MTRHRIPTRHLAGFVCVLLLGTAALAPSTVEASPTRVESLWLMDADGSNQRQVLEHFHPYNGFEWSPDATRLAYSDGNDIFIAAVDPWSPINVTATPGAPTGGYETHPTWSPDGMQISFTDRGDIWVMSAEGSDRTRLTGSLDQDGSPRWAPTGSRIAYLSSAYLTSPETWGPPMLHILDAETGDHVVVAETAHDRYPFSWAPDGDRIAYLDQDGHVTVYGLDGRDSTIIASQSARSLAWSPDGTMVAFATASGVFVVDAEGGVPQHLFDPVKFYDRLSWSPDSSKLAFADFNDVRVADLATGGTSPLTEGNDIEDESPLWSPDGSRFAFIGATWCCAPTHYPTHVSLDLSGHLVARGQLDTYFTDCLSSRAVKIQRRRNGAWRTIARGSTGDDHRYRIRVPDRRGRYRVVAPPRVVVENYKCMRGISPIVRHRH